MTASISLLSLPGIDSVTRLGAMLSLVCSASSLGASFVNLQRRLRLKAHQPHTSIDDESLVRYSVCEIIFDRFHTNWFVPQSTNSRHYYVQSMPLLFLTWAVITLVASTFVYAFRGYFGQPDSRYPQGDHAIPDMVLHWVVAGVGAVMAIALIFSAWVTRR